MELNEFRKQIDQIDTKIVELMVERFQVSKEIGEYKKEKGLEIRNEEREKELILNKINTFKARNFSDEEFVKEFFELIIRKSREIQ